MRVIHINKNDIRGGAARFALALHQGLLKRNIISLILVDIKYSILNEVIALESDKYRGAWFKVFNRLAKFFYEKKTKGSWFLFNIFRAISIPLREIYNELGIDYFNYPGLRSKLPQLLEPSDTIVQVYVAHGNYLDLPYLKKISKENIVVIRMPDAWLLSGHCAHSFDCERWKTGCGKCPDLSIPPKVNRDATEYNWKVKVTLYKGSRFHIVTPSVWLMKKVQESMLMEAAKSLNVIPNGVDIDVFSPGKQAESRVICGIDSKATVLLFSANGIKKNRWKDFALLEKLLKQLSVEKIEGSIEFIGLGERADDEIVGTIRVRYIKYEEDPRMLAHYYRCADVYLHPTKADSFPNSVLEALACGIPVIANGIGGVPEQVKSLSSHVYTSSKGEWEEFNPEDATGMLVQPGDSIGFFNAVNYLLKKQNIRLQLGINARQDACLRFSQQRVTEDYIALYHQLSNKN